MVITTGGTYGILYPTYILTGIIYKRGLKLDIQKLKYFKELCKCRNITAAAKNLYISQQGLSMAIIRLEAQLGSKLFERTPKGLKLTSDGEFLLKHTNVIIDEYAECERHFKHIVEKLI